MQVPSSANDLENWNYQRAKLCACIKEFLDGKLNLLPFARVIVQYSFLFQSENDPDFNLFRAIDSETDHLPIGNIRDHWHPESLRIKDQEIQKFEDYYRDRTLIAARNILSKLAD